MLMVFNDNISVTSLWSVLLVELTGETTNLQQGIANFYHIILFSVHIRTKNAHMCGITTGVIFLFVVVVY
jgi:hypothetical protein